MLTYPIISHNHYYFVLLWNCIVRTWILWGWEFWHKIGERAYNQESWYKIQLWWQGLLAIWAYNMGMSWLLCNVIVVWLLLHLDGWISFFIHAFSFMLSFVRIISLVHTLLWTEIVLSHTYQVDLAGLNLRLSWWVHYMLWMLI